MYSVKLDFMSYSNQYFPHWSTYALLQQSPSTRFGLAYITPLLKVTQPANQQLRKRTVVTRRSIIGCRQGVLPNQRTVTDRQASACVQSTQNLHSYLIERIKFPVNKTSLAIVPF